MFLEMVLSDLVPQITWGAIKEVKEHVLGDVAL